MDEFQAVADVSNAEAIIRSTIQHQRDRLSYLFAGSEQSIFNTIFADHAAPLYGQAEQFRLGRLPDIALAEFIEDKFTTTDRDVGMALPHLLAASRGHPQRAAFLAHEVWQATGPGGTATVETWKTAYAEVMARSHHEFVAVESGLETGQRKTARLLAWRNHPTVPPLAGWDSLRGPRRRRWLHLSDAASPGVRTGKILNWSIRSLPPGSRDRDPRP